MFLKCTINLISNNIFFSNKLSPKLSMDVSNNSIAYLSLNNNGALYMFNT